LDRTGRVVSIIGLETSAENLNHPWLIFVQGLEQQLIRIMQSFWVPHKSRVNIPVPKCDADPCGGVCQSVLYLHCEEPL